MPGTLKNSLNMRRKPDGNNWLVSAVIALTAAILFVPFLGGVHLFDWDEINFAESAREMIESGNYLTVQINYLPFWEKPPLFIWMQVLSMKLFGINEFGARFPNAACGIVSLLVLYNLGRKQVSPKFGLLWVLFYAGSLLPFFYFKSGIIDPWFNLFIFLGIYKFYLYLNAARNSYAAVSWSAFFLGLAILTKGPVALLIFLLTAGTILIVKKFRVRITPGEVLIFVSVLVITGGFWFILQILQGNFGVVADFIHYQVRLFMTKDAGHGGFLLYHFVVLFAGVFPASVFALPVLLGMHKTADQKDDLFRWMLILFWVVLLLFTLVSTKIVHYSSLCYFPLTFMASWSFYHARNYHTGWKVVTPVLILILGLILAVVVTTLTFIDHFKYYLINHNWIGDPFARACLMADGGWKGYEFISGLFILAGITGYSLYWLKRNYEYSLFVLTGTFPVFMFVAMWWIVPRVETYSQRPAIEFFSSVSDQDAYLETVGYKSYVHLFYGRIKDHPGEKARDEKWLLTGPIDKPAYFAVKVNKSSAFMQQYPEVAYLYEKNGFAFFKRIPNSVK